MNSRLLCVLIASFFGGSIFADSPREPEPYLTDSGGSSGRGSFLFSMVPANAKMPNVNVARGIAYRIAENGGLSEIWRSDGWYSDEVYLANDGHHLVRMGQWNSGHKLKPDHLAIAFYKDGKLLRQ